ncbi:polysaccharide lyase 8 family protein [Ruminococcaceae bacterium OttesenSCG-928-A16]|nr:polysaccharide lyase 8 family protein [Ruminococcaceae bacterium OttesenSCG-928-A16]
MAETITKPNPQIEKIATQWVQYLAGNANTTVPPAYLARVNHKAQAAYTTLHKTSPRTCLWADLDMAYIEGIGQEAKMHTGNMATAFYRLRNIALGWATKGAVYYQNPQVLQQLLSGLAFMHQHHYNQSEESTPFFGNWWSWEIGIPIAFLSSVLLLRPHIPPAQIQAYAAAVNRFSSVCNQPSGYPGSPEMTGANLVDKSVATTLCAILLQDETKLNHVKTALKTTLQYVHTGDGFYADGSYIQHQALAYIGGYGKDLFEKFSLYFTVLNGTPWQLTYPDHAETLLFDFIESGVQPFFAGPLFMDMVSGRDIARKKSTDKRRGAKKLAALLPLANSMPAGQAAGFIAFAQPKIAADPDYFLQNCTNMAAALAGATLLQNHTPQPPAPANHAHIFAGMDKAVYHTPAYSFGVSMHSSRTYGYEVINEEGKQCWHVADGMTALYLPEDNQYANGYWATVNPLQLPGTTTQQLPPPKYAGERQFGHRAWVGGASLGNLAGAAMQLQAWGPTGQPNGTRATKSWFMLGADIVALGSGITCQTPGVIQTTLENRRQPANFTSLLLANGQPVFAPEGNNQTTTIHASWLHLSGQTADSGIGYVLPQSTMVHAQRQTRQGNWFNQGNNHGEETGRFVSLAIHHGEYPKNAGYCYTLLPTATAAQTQAYAAQNPVQIIQNSEQIHAIAKPAEGITAAHFFAADGGQAGIITTNAPAAVLVQQTGNQLRVAIANPTQLQTVPLTLQIALPAKKLLHCHNAITVTQTSPYIMLQINPGGLAGQSVTAAFTLAL